MATLKILALELSKAFVLYRQPMPEREEFELLVRAWGDVLAEWAMRSSLRAYAGLRPD